MAVVDVQVLQRGHVDTLQAAQESITNDDRLGRLDTGSAEGQSVERAERVPVKTSDTGKRRERQSGETSEVVQRKGTGDGLEGGARESGQETSVLNGQITVDCCKASEIDGTLGVLADNDVTLEGLAR